MKEDSFSSSSELKMYSTAIVVSNTNGYIQASPVETMNLQEQGRIYDPDKPAKKVVGDHPTDKGGAGVKSEVSKGNYVSAKWLAISCPNRATAPVVYPNETVMLYKYGNVDEYFWTTKDYEPGLRKREDVTFTISDIDPKYGWDEKGEPIPIDKENSYYFTVKNEGITISTPKKDMEPGNVKDGGHSAKFVIEIDTKAGLLTIRDDGGKSENTVILDSVNGILTIKTGNVVNISTTKLLSLEAKDIAIKGNLTVKGSANVDGTLYTTGDINCAKTVKLKTLSYSPSSASFRPSSPSDILKELKEQANPGASNPFAALSSISVPTPSGLSNMTSPIAGINFGGAASGVIGGVVGSVTGAVGGVISSGTSVIGGVVTAGSNALGQVVDMGGNVINSASSAVSGVVGSVAGVVDGVVGSVNGVVGGVLNTANSLVSTGIGATQSLVYQAANAIPTMSELAAHTQLTALAGNVPNVGSVVSGTSSDMSSVLQDSMTDAVNNPASRTTSSSVLSTMSDSLDRA